MSYFSKHLLTRLSVDSLLLKLQASKVGAKESGRSMDLQRSLAYYLIPVPHLFLFLKYYYCPLRLINF